METRNASSTGSEMSFEEAFATLEEVLAKLEGGDLPLEESLALFESGSALAAQCAQRLDEAELRGRRWQPGDTTRPLDGWEGDNAG